MARSKAPFPDVALTPVVVALLLACCYTVRLDTAQPDAVAADASAGAFSAVRAVNTARLLTAHGPRPAGSTAEAAAFQVRVLFLAAPCFKYPCLLSRHARGPDARLVWWLATNLQYVEATLSALASSLNANNGPWQAELDQRTGSGAVRYFGGAARATERHGPRGGGGAAVQVPPEGAFFADTLYSNLTLLALRLTRRQHGGGTTTGSSGGRDTLLLSVHVDTQWTGVGACDNSGNLGAALEVAAVTVANVLEAQRAGGESAAAAALASPIMFLFQSNEEDGMLGASSFVSSHPWASTVSGVINLEAMGCGGRPTLFQATAGSEWLLTAFAAAKHSASGGVRSTAVGMDVYNSGLVNSDTDLRILAASPADDVAGVDIVFLSRGSVYHTAKDNMEGLAASQGHLQTLGDALVAVMRTAAQPRRVMTQPGARPPAMFDLAGTMVVHPRPSPLAGALLAPALLYAASRYDRLLPWLTAAVLASWLASILAAVATARLLGSMAPMTFYAGPSQLEACSRAAGLYVPPAVLGALTLMTAAADAVERRNARTASGLMTLVPSTQRRLLLATALAHAAAFCFLALRNMGSSYIPLYCSLLPAAALLLLPSAALPIAVALPASLFLAPVGFTMWEVMRGLVGRADASLGGGPKWGADAQIAGVIGLWTALLCSYLQPIIATREVHVTRTLTVCFTAFILAIGAAAVLKHPFDEAHPRLVMLTHVFDTSSSHSALVLASLAPGPPLRSVARRISKSFVGSAGARGAGSTLKHVCYSGDDPASHKASSLATSLVTANPGAWCELATTSRDGMAAQALSALQWRSPALLLQTLTNQAIDQPQLRAVVLLDPSTARRWALAMNPALVVRYAAAFGNQTERNAPPEDAPLPWSPVRAVPPSITAMTRLTWPVVRHSGAVGGGLVTLWLDLRLNTSLAEATNRLLADGGDEVDPDVRPRRPEPALRLRVDWTDVETVAWRAASTALPRTVGLFAKATLPQMLAVVADLRL
jgi:hypothetical protein